MPRATKSPVILCRHKGCRQPIRKETIGGKYPTWLHTATNNIYCLDNIPGMTARFAEPD